MSASAAPAAKTALLNALRAWHSDDPGVLVRRGLPPAVPRQSHRIYVAAITEHRVSGAGDPREETFAVTVIVEAHSTAASTESEAAEADMWRLVDSVRDVVRQDSELDGTVWTAAYAGADELVPAVVDDGWIAAARVRVACSVRIEE